MRQPGVGLSKTDEWLVALGRRPCLIALVPGPWVHDMTSATSDNPHAYPSRATSTLPHS